MADGLGAMADATTQMVDAAERIVAESGFAAMTASAVQEAAGQGNKSAVQYHFGDRDGLIQAVMDARMAPANKRRMGMLERLESKVGHSAMESVQSEAFRAVHQLLLERLDHLPAELRASLAPDKPGGS